MLGLPPKARRLYGQALQAPILNIVVHSTSTNQIARCRARNWNSAGMRIRPPPFPGAKRIRGFKVGWCRRRAPAISVTFMAATILEGGCREASGRIRMKSAGGYENAATGYVVAERPLFELSTA